MKLNEVKQRMANGQLYYPTHEELVEEQLEHLDLLFEYNQLKPSKQAQKQELLKKMFAEIGENCYIETPFHANWGGKNVHFGKEIYANFNLTLVDDGNIFVGDYVMFGPNVDIVSATHPIHPELRKKEAQYNLNVHIEENVWIGAHSVILPGVRIGENNIIGAGSVVTKDIPPNVIAVGSPCKILREINQNDLKYYRKNFEIDLI